MMRRALFALLALVLLAPAPAIAQTATPLGTPPAPVVRTLVYHELSALTASPNNGGEEAPVLSDDGQRLVYAVAPGGGAANPNRIFVMAAAGGDPRQVDSYPSLCACGSAIDLSADGRTVVSADSVQIRIADAGGTTGRELIALNSNELNGLRLSGDGRTVVFRVYRDTSGRGSSPERPIARGVWAINADGTGLRQVVGPRQLEAMDLAPTVLFGSNGRVLDLSADGSRLVFGAYHDPQGAGDGQGLFAVNLDGSGLRELVGRVSYVNDAAISADGAMVAYGVVDAAGTQEAGVIGFDGGGRRPLTSSAVDHPLTGRNVAGSDERLGLSGDGHWLLLGNTGLLYRTDGGEVVQLGARGGCCSGDAAPLVYDGLYRATMDRTARRFLYLAADRVGVLQLARLGLDPPDPGAAPRVTDVAIVPPVVRQHGASSATLTARVTHAPVGAAVRSVVLLAPGLHGAAGEPEVRDPHVATPPLVDDGSHGDAVAGDRVSPATGSRPTAARWPGRGGSEFWPRRWAATSNATRWRSR